VSVRRRLDSELVRRGLATSRGHAHGLIAAGRVLVGGALAERPARQVLPGDPILVTGERDRFVSRGGAKLDAALEQFGIDVRGARALDAGASTGGFTDCLLQRGATHVTALDVGRGQLHERLCADPRVTNVERTNLRSVAWRDLADKPFDVAVADLSFISLRTVARPLVAMVRPNGTVVVLVKPQFEVGRRDAARGRGVVRDPQLWASALTGAASALEAAGSTMMGAMVSPLRGADGNVEFLAHFQVRPAPPVPLETRVDIAAVIAAADR
jgi:23S rRNA (cytidine1920-2'-O)/16S rRNA (cytidine1409-2'-O)-methyltransferase